MDNVNMRYSVDLWRIPVTLADAAQGDWVEVGLIKGVCVTPSDPDTDDRCVVQIHGGTEDSWLVASGAAIAEGDPLIWDQALRSGAGAFTNLAADDTNYDVVAGYQCAVASGQTAQGPIWVGIIPHRPSA